MMNFTTAMVSGGIGTIEQLAVNSQRSSESKAEGRKNQKRRLPF
ncbi:hypothetical protein [Microcoleus sp. EPA2]